jgi:hypothetical protein
LVKGRQLRGAFFFINKLPLAAKKLAEMKIEEGPPGFFIS